jgi:hypothetical protein
VVAEAASQCGVEALKSLGRQRHRRQAPALQRRDLVAAMGPQERWRPNVMLHDQQVAHLTLLHHRNTS